MTAAREAGRSRVLLIGDSITRSYYPHVQERLAERYAGARIASSKCVADPTCIKELELLLGEYEFSLIHFNNGLHGWDYSEEDYAGALAQAFDLLLAHCGVAGFIWGSTTPVWEPDSKALAKRTERVRERNKIAAALADDRGVRVNDLFAAVVDRPELFSKDGVHFLDTGQALLGKCVADTILNMADNRTEPGAQ